MNDREAGRLVSYMIDAWSRNVTEGTIHLYMDQLTPVEYEVGDQAVARLINECEFFPTIAKLREYIAACTPRSVHRALSEPEPSRDMAKVRELLKPARDALGAVQAGKRPERTEETPEWWAHERKDLA